MKRILLLVFWCSASLWADAQALLGTTGLLHAPTADMQRDTNVPVWWKLFSNKSKQRISGQISVKSG